MKKLVIDTNIFTAFGQGDATVAGLLQSIDEIYLPYIVIGELHHGFYHGKKPQENISFLKSFMDSPRMTILMPLASTPRIYGELMSELQSAGKPMQTNDVWIAALCKENDLPLATFDKGFRNILGLELVDL